jgi:tetratricopeptide (TPR) repeat protein
MLVIFAATALAYLPALRGGLLWDDDGHVTRADLQSLEGLRRIWFEVGATQQYYPLLHTAFWLEHRLWGGAPLGYHLLNVLLHATAACLLALVVRRLLAAGDRSGAATRPSPKAAAGGAGAGTTDTTGRACLDRDGMSAAPWFAALIFALHPVGVESVAWISEQKNTLSAVFYLSAALAYLDFDQSRRPSRYWAALGLFAAALLTKTVTATLPAALLVVLWWRRGRLGWRRDIIPLTPWLALGAVAGGFSAWFERDLIGARGAEFSLTAIERLLLAGRVIWFYLGKLAWPADLVFIYPRWGVAASPWWQFHFPAGALLLAGGLAWLARRQRAPLAGFLFFAGTLFPVLGFVNVYPFVFSYVADHFQYLASLGVIVPAAAGLTAAARRLLPGRPMVAWALAGVLLATLGGLTWRQSATYRDAETLYRATLARNPTCAMAHNNLGLVLSQIPGRLPEATAQFEAALRYDPRNLEAHLNLGYTLARMPGRLLDAIKVDEAAVRLDPNRADAHDNLGTALARAPGREADAVAEFETAVRLAPGVAEMRDHLGMALAGIPGRLPEAISQLETAVRLDPSSAGAHGNLGRALLRVPGRWLQAVAELEAAVRLDPGSADRHGALGSALLQDPGRLPQAITEFEAVVRISPDLAEGRYVLGLLLSSQPGRRREALAQLETALRLQPGFEVAREAIEKVRALPPD